MTKEYCVYMHRFPNGKVYIGQTCQTPSQRFKNGRGYRGCSYLESAIQKYGWENVEHIILKDRLDENGANEWERKYIDQYKSNHKECGYNLRSGGTQGYYYTDDVRKKMRAKRLGKKQSEQTRKQRSESLLKFYSTHSVSKETREKLRASAYQNTSKKSVVQYDKNGNEIAVYPSIRSASAAMGKTENAVSNAIKGRSKTCGGYIWRYADADKSTV